MTVHEQRRPAALHEYHLRVRLVERCGGWIGCAEAPGGTMLTFTVPADAAVAA